MEELGRHQQQYHGRRYGRTWKTSTTTPREAIWKNLEDINNNTTGGDMEELEDININTMGGDMEQLEDININTMGGDMEQLEDIIINTMGSNKEELTGTKGKIWSQMKRTFTTATCHHPYLSRLQPQKPQHQRRKDSMLKMKI